MCKIKIRREPSNRARPRVMPRILLTGLGLCAASGMAATLCVNPGGHGGCYSTIGAAVAAASSTDTIQVAHGTYSEFVTIPKSLSLIGDNRENTIIDATGQPFGIYVDGHDNAGLGAVVISGFTVRNADNAGIAVSNASDVTISDNEVTHNDKGLAPKCTTLGSFPYFFGEAPDCGEGIFLSGVDHSTISNNVVTANAGGILITDDTGPTHDNLIAGNSVVKNTSGDCGITIPSHSGAGVYHNTVSGNDSSNNSGPGVGIFAPGPGSKAFANVVVNNRLRGNGFPGVTMHNHAAPGVGKVPAGAPPVLFDDNVIVGNDVSDNAADPGPDSITSGPTGINIYSVAPMSGTVISGNTIHQEVLDIVVKVPSSVGGPTAVVHLNNLPDGVTGLENLGAALVDATQNWWGCSGGPAAGGCSTVSGSVLFTPWLHEPMESGHNDN